MKRYLFVFLLLLLSLNSQAEPIKRFVFELGELNQPPDTRVEIRPSAMGKVYLLIRDKKTPPAVFMVTLTKQGVSMGQDSQQDLKRFVESYCAQLAELLTLEATDVRVFPADRGCRFSFRIKGAGQNYGRLFLGRTDTLILTGLGVARWEMWHFAESFETMPGMFERAFTKAESGKRAAAGYSWMCGGIDLVLALIVGLLSLGVGRRFWVAVRNVLLFLWVVEWCGGVAYSWWRWNDLALTGHIAEAGLAGLLVTVGAPAGLAHWISRQTRWPAFWEKK